MKSTERAVGGLLCAWWKSCLTSQGALSERQTAGHVARCGGKRTTGTDSHEHHLRVEGQVVLIAVIQWNWNRRNRSLCVITTPRRNESWWQRQPDCEERLKCVISRFRRKQPQGTDSLQKSNKNWDSSTIVGFKSFKIVFISSVLSPPACEADRSGNFIGEFCERWLIISHFSPLCVMDQCQGERGREAMSSICRVVAFLAANSPTSHLICTPPFHKVEYTERNAPDRRFSTPLPFQGGCAHQACTWHGFFFVCPHKWFSAVLK